MIAKRSSLSGAGRAGFTLVEVLVTLLLIGIALPAIMHGITSAQIAGASAKRYNEATELAKSQLAQILAGSQWNSNASLSGDFSPNFPDYQWKATVAPWDLDTSGMGINQIDLTVSWQDRGRPASLTLTSLAYLRGEGSTQQ
jgi:prepilin-type N-terminal cleavage/methylation domain-containing protein